VSGYFALDVSICLPIALFFYLAADFLFLMTLIFFAAPSSFLALLSCFLFP
jgi:hypothetical protein